MNEQPAVFVVDDDISVREALKNLFRSVGLKVQTCSNAQEFLSTQRPDAPSCLVLDVRLPCVLTVVKEISNPRLPTLGGKIKARQSAITVWTAEAIGADPAKLGLKGSPTRVVKIHKPKV